MEKWIPSEAVQFLEADYDDLVWDFINDESTDDETGWLTTNVVVIDDEGYLTRFVQRPYDRPLFELRDSAVAGPSIDVDAFVAGLGCTLCRDAVNHHCDHCDKIIDHMTGMLCPACWLAVDDDDDEPDPPG